MVMLISLGDILQEYISGTVEKSYSVSSIIEHIEDK